MTMTMTGPAVWEAARKRLEERRNEYRTYTEAEERQAWLEGRTLPRTSIYAPQFRPPQTAAEYFDDRILERNQSFWWHPETLVLIGVAAAARDSAEAAVRAVKAARHLDRRAQWVAYQSLLEWKRGNEAARTGAERTVNAVLAEFSRLGLAESDPDDE